MKYASLFCAAALTSLTACTHVDLSYNVPSGGVLEDAILIASSGGAAPREAKALGDIDLSAGAATFKYDLAAASTHWWIIGHRGGEVVFSSNVDLSGVDLYSVEPYAGATPLDWNIPANLNAFVMETGYSLDWWAQTVNNHASHVAADTNSATLWTFGTAGSEIGTMSADLHAK